LDLFLIEKNENAFMIQNSDVADRVLWLELHGCPYPEFELLGVLEVREGHGLAAKSFF